MVSSSLLQRVALMVLPVVLLSGCMDSQRFPLVDVGVSSADRQLVGRVGAADRQLLGPVTQDAAYAAPETANVAAVDEPLADGQGYQTMTAMRTTQGMQGEQGTQTANAASGGYIRDLTTETLEPDMGGETQTAFAVTDEGINIDAGLGIQPGGTVFPPNGATGQRAAGVQPHLVTQQGAMAIAEGQTSQPVVDGIGFDNPTALNEGVASDFVTGPVVAPAQAVAQAPQQIEPQRVEPQRVAPQGNQTPRSQGQRAAKDCSLFLDKRNCR
ncbi:hypothetical protein FE840_013825 [Peteryoungia desertarenae]|uniref:Uncharacterized protein n=1 Tax=Peteryoungia desertarenae TaxID=1813451 RepID=A0ABX6QQU6_9HYPH|nr:hypothetical protein [Peteryoungia desertarenae]QLF70525.1 hypothetical protein FE840_013825 [Peteryoungia desertarenae]